MDVIKNAKKIHGCNVYINEHLTKRNLDLAHKAWKMIYDIYMDA